MAKVEIKLGETKFHFNEASDAAEYLKVYAACERESERIRKSQIPQSSFENVPSFVVDFCKKVRENGLNAEPSYSRIICDPFPISKEQQKFNDECEANWKRDTITLMDEDGNLFFRNKKVYEENGFLKV